MSNLPLAGKKVLVTRAKEQAAKLSNIISANGGTPIEVPLIAFERVNHKEIDEKIQRLHTYDWLLLTSVNGVHFFMETYKKWFPECTSFPSRIAVVGKKTEQALRQYGFQADLIPTDYSAEGMAELLVEHVSAGDTLLLARGNLGRNVLNVQLTKKGAYVDDVTLYKTVAPKDALHEMERVVKRNPDIHIATFTSSSTVSHYASIVTELKKKGIHFNPRIACIGPIAEQTAKDLGLVVHVVPPVYTIESLVEHVIQYVKEEKI